MFFYDNNLLHIGYYKKIKYVENQLIIIELEKIILEINKIEKKKDTTNNINIENIEEISIQIGENNTTNNAKESDITENERKEIKEYLSKTYDIDSKNIEIS